MNKFTTRQKQLADYEQHLTFNYKCKNYKVFPASLHVKPLVNTRYGKKIAREASLRYVHARVLENHSSLARIRKEILSLKNDLRCTLQETTNIRLLDFCENIYSNEKLHKKEFLKSKFTALVERSRITNNLRNNNLNTVKNLSNRVLTKDEEYVLEKGLNFAPTPSNIPKDKYIFKLEPLINNLPRDHQPEIRLRLTNALRNFRISDTPNLTSSEKSALANLTKYDDVKILPADKGRTTVIMNSTDYENKVLEIVEDTDNYTSVRNDPTSSIENKLRNLLSKWKQNNFIDENTYKRLLILNGRLPQFYALPKIHKTGIPLRPIVSFCGSPLYALAKFLQNILRPLISNNQLVIKNSYEFADFIKNQILPIHHKMVSFDVKSLFPSIPQDLAITCIYNKLYSNEHLFPGTQINLIMEGIELCLDKTFFISQDKIKKQIKGVPMGSSLSPVIADIVMEHIETTAMDTFVEDIVIYRRYVDDTFVVLPENSINSFHNHLNSINPSIQFTLEKESNNQLPFLDVLVTRSVNGTISTSIYKKDTHTDQYLNFNSYQPVEHKAAVIKTLIHRAKEIPSNEQLKEIEISKVKHSLRKNAYPSQFINKIVAKETLPREEDNDNKHVILPYIKGLSENLRRVFKNHNVNLHFKSNFTIRNKVTKLKDKIKPLKNNNLVYKINCSECPISYVGETKQRLEKRIDQHQAAVRRGDANHSGMSEHCVENLHSFSKENVKIIENNLSFYAERKYAEAVHIKKTSNNCNRDSGYNIPEIYHPVLF